VADTAVRPVSAAPASDSERSKRLILVALIVATFLVALDQAVISTAMPTVIGQLGGINLYAWVFSAYLLTSTISVPIYGKLSDLYGRKPLFLAATAIFLVGSALCGQSQTMTELIAFRLVQGLGAGGVFPITQTIIGDIFPLQQRARLQGVFSTIWGVSGVLGPAIGGFLTQQASWRWCFYVNLPLSLLAIVLVARFLNEHVVRRSHRIDYAGAVLLTLSVTLLLVALQLPSSGDSGLVLPIALIAIAVGLLFAFVWQERRHPEPMVTLSLFANRAIGIGTLGAMVTGVVLFCQTVFVPPFVQGVLGSTPTVAGFVLAATSIGWPIASTAAGFILLRVGFRPPAVFGGLLLTAGFALMAMQTASSTLVFLAVLQVVLGVGFGLYLPVVLLAVQNAVGWEQRGVVTSANQFARTIGGTIGVAVAGAIFAAGVDRASALGANPNDLLDATARAALDPGILQPLTAILTDSLHAVYLMCVVVALFSTLVALVLPGGKPSTAATSASPSDAVA
jgi:EmrB/QacA subfamily drug resistance transporter